MGLLKRIAVGTGITGLAAGFVLGLVSTGSGFGSRGVKEVYSFQYGGKRAVVVEDDRIMAKDNMFYIKLENGDIIYKGTITSDDNKEVGLEGTHAKASNYSVED